MTVKTPFLAFPVLPSEEVAVEALIHDRLSFAFATGRCEFVDGQLRVEVKDIHVIIAMLKSLNSAWVEDGAARTLIRRIEAVMK